MSCMRHDRKANAAKVASSQVSNTAGIQVWTSCGCTTPLHHDGHALPPGLDIPASDLRKPTKLAQRYP